MPDLTPHELPAPETADDDPRLGRWLARQNEVADRDVVIVGFPSDEGVRRIGGRPGAADAPRAIREALYRLTPDAEHFDAFTRILERTADIGDVPVTGDVEVDQQSLGECLASLLDSRTVIVLGGGHETTFGHFLGYAYADLEVDILNIDAHADVRPLINGRGHSGSPFRQALEHDTGACRRYRVAGLQPHSLARSHLDLITERGGEAYFAHEITAPRVYDLCADLQYPALVTFDLDAVSAAHAPGVSAPNVAGLDPGLWLHAALRAGTAPGVRSIDIVEANPRFDPDGRTARLAALTVWHFLRGLALR